MSIPSELVRDVELLCLDAGNTVVFLDHARLARLASALGFHAEERTLVRAEGEAKRALADRTFVDVAWAARAEPGALGWGRVIATLLARAGADERALPRMLEALWGEHRRFNLWSRVPDGLRAALGRARGAGVKVAVVSNSEGRLLELLGAVGLGGAFDVVADSGLLGVEKPDPRIFAYVLEACSVNASRALHLGDTWATDVVGARAAGVRTALIDPFGHYEGSYPDVLRVPDVEAVVDAILAQRAPV
jgi:putative hydrolase of the HAD superfamily